MDNITSIAETPIDDMSVFILGWECHYLSQLGVFSDDEISSFYLKKNFFDLSIMCQFMCQRKLSVFAQL